MSRHWSTFIAGTGRPDEARRGERAANGSRCAPRVRQHTVVEQEDAMAAVGFSKVVTENVLITPAGLAINDPDRPASIVDQPWLIHYSGVGILDLKGNNAND